MTPGGAHRITGLDIARGLAILGTLATNIWIFMDPEGLYGFLGPADGDGSAWATAERVLQQLPNGKFLALLTLLFGVGLELQRRSAVRGGRRWPGSYPWRAALLFVDGLLHFLLIAEFDILMGYAVTGVVVAYLLATSERTQRVWTVIAAAVHVTLLSALTVLLALSPDEADAAPLDPNPYADGSWWDLVVFRAENAALFRAEPVFIMAMSIAAFLVGAQLVRARLLEADGARLRRRLIVAGLVALVVDLVVGLTGGIAGVLATRYSTALVVGLGLLATVLEVTRRGGGDDWASHRLTEVGRTALSCYVLQNVVASAICYGWGLGVAARAGDERVPVTLVVYSVTAAAVVAFAHLWLRRFARGPLEIAWHRGHDLLAGGRSRHRSAQAAPAARHEAPRT